MKTNNLETQKIRVRFAPSPTGPLHIGGARTALFNFIFAKQNNGEFILRIEDTDKQRSELKWVPEIIDELKWLGIKWNEGPDIGGDFGPYKQSQKTDTYKKYLEKLLTENKAYFCDCSAEELEAKREGQQARGEAPKYDGKCRDKKKTSGVIRFKIENKKVRFTDIIRGEVEFDMGLLGDIVIAKDLETPLYHFVVVIDDCEMKISHVIRGEEHLSNTPRQILLQHALGFSQPQYAHLPLMLNTDKSKMSKRVGDVALADYHKKGYLPEAIVNFIMMLGWNPGTEKEIFSLPELIKEFSLEKVQKAGAVFNIVKLDSINSYYIRQKSKEALTQLCAPFLSNFNTDTFTKHQLENIIALHQPRLKKLSDITELVDYFFAENITYDTNMLRWQKMGDSDIKDALNACLKVLENLTTWTKDSLEHALVQEAKLFNLGKNYPLENKGYLLWPLRVALSGKSASAGPFEIAEILGKEKTFNRIQNAIKSLS